MAIEANPILPYRKNLVQYILAENYILEPSKVITMIPYDARTELDRARHSLDWSLNAKPMFNFRMSAPEEESARVDAWYNARIAEIKRAEQQFRQGLAGAEKTGAITTSEADRLSLDLGNPFERARREADELYRKERKFI